MKKIKVLHFLESEGVYGAERVLLNLSQEMLKTSIYEPVVGCIVQEKNEQSDLFDMASSMGIDAKKIVINNKLFFLHIPIVAFLLKRNGINLIHSHGYKPSIIGFVIRMLVGIPVCVTCHLWFSGPKPPLKYVLMTWLEVFLYRFFSNIVAVSKPIKEHLISRGVRKDKITTIKNGINLKDYEKQSHNNIRRLRAELKITNDSIVILNIGRLSEQKAQINIILASKLLKEKGIKANFIIIGEGSLRHSLESLIKEKNVAKEVKLLGFRNDVKDLLHLADIFLLPSLDEGLPISLLEAIACKTPIISTSVGDIPKLIGNKKDGLFIPLNDVKAIVDSIEWMIHNSEKRRELANNAYINLEKHYSAGKMLKNYDKIYKKIGLRSL